MRPGARGWPAAEDIIGEFWLRRQRTSQRELDVLTTQFKIPIAALTSDESGIDLPMITMRVERSGRTFDFVDDPTARPVCGFVCWDLDGLASDIAAWSPRDGWTGTWLGRAALLNEFELSQPRIDDHIRAFWNVADWLRSNRSGCVIIDRAKAARLLRDVVIEAVDVEDGTRLREMIERPARIVVPTRQPEKIAA